MRIKPTPIISINANNTIQSFKVARPKRKDPNEGRCPYCHVNIKEEYGYVYYTTPIEEYGTYSEQSFEFDGREQTGVTEFFCPSCDHALTKKQVDKMIT